jgi:hypothetical protein
MSLRSCVAIALSLLTASLSGSAVASVEQPTLWQSVHELFTWNHGNSGVYPIVEVDVGRKTSAGAALFLREVGRPGNDVRLTLAGGLDGLLEVSAMDRLALSDRQSVFLRAQYRQRPDGLFYGLGGETRSEDKTVFELRSPELAAGLDRQVGDVLRLQLEALFRAPRFEGSDAMSTPSLTSRFGGAGQPPLPAGFDGYQVLMGRAGATLDSRAGRPTGSGVRLAADVGYAVDPGASATRWLDWGGAAAGLVDFTGRGHQLGTEIVARLVEKQGSDDVPFTELVALGGRQLMRGFLPGRLRGDSALVWLLYYQQPIAGLLQAQLFLDLGNVFPGRLRELDPTNLYGDYGLRLETTFSREASIALLAGFGTTRVDASDFDALADTRMSVFVSHPF